MKQSKFLIGVVGFVVLILIILFTTENHDEKKQTEIKDETKATSTEQTPQLSFEFPTLTSMAYIKATDWPPVVTEYKEPYSCAPAGKEIDRSGVTSEGAMKDVRFCKTIIAEGAAGSIYREYAYLFPQGTGTIGVTFSLQFPQCMNYDEPKRSECKAEEGAFNPDSLVRSGLLIGEEVTQTHAPKTFTWTCPDTSTFSITYGTTSEDATITNGMDTYAVRVAQSGSGARYLSEDGSVEYWEHGGEARLTIDNKLSHENCVIDK